MAAQVEKLTHVSPAAPGPAWGGNSRWPRRPLRPNCSPCGLRRFGPGQRERQEPEQTPKRKGGISTRLMKKCPSCHA